MQTWIETVRDGLKRLRSATRPPDFFGAEEHRFTLRRPLPEAKVVAFEQQHKIRLPDEYRDFLIHLGNGGAGPYYGVFKLGETDEGEKWDEGDGFVGILSKPFPHACGWNDLTGEPDDEMDDDEEYEEALEAFEAKYWSPDLVNGAIPICHEGCALRDWLIVTGPEAGNVWHDGRPDREGLLPVVDDNLNHMTFKEWYLSWLEDAVAVLPKSKP